jgi:hypothetical protein
VEESVRATLLGVVFSGVKPFAQRYVPLLCDFTRGLDSLTTLLSILITIRGISTPAQSSDFFCQMVIT